MGHEINRQEVLRGCFDGVARLRNTFPEQHEPRAGVTSGAETKLQVKKPWGRQADTAPFDSTGREREPPRGRARKIIRYGIRRLGIPATHFNWQRCNAQGPKSLDRSER
jgi:hypothetical protein